MLTSNTKKATPTQTNPPTWITSVGTSTKALPTADKEASGISLPPWLDPRGFQIVSLPQQLAPYSVVFWREVWWG